MYLLPCCALMVRFEGEDYDFGVAGGCGGGENSPVEESHFHLFPDRLGYRPEHPGTV